MSTVELIPLLISAGLLALITPYSQLKLVTTIPTASSVFAATMGGLALLWSIDVELLAGLSLHFLMLTSASLILGFRLACLTGLLALLILASMDQLIWERLPTLWSFLIVPVCAMSYASLLITRHYLPRHLFVYIFVNGFLSSAISLALGYLVLALWFWQVGSYSGAELYQHQLKVLPLMLFPEALLNGMAITLLTVYKPKWLRTFSDQDYLS